MNIQGWFPLGLTGLISLLSKGLSRVISSTTVQKHQFFGAQPSLWSSSHVHTCSVGYWPHTKLMLCWWPSSPILQGPTHPCPDTLTSGPWTWTPRSSSLNSGLLPCHWEVRSLQFPQALSLWPGSGYDSCLRRTLPSRPEFSASSLQPPCPVISLPWQLPSPRLWRGPLSSKAKRLVNKELLCVFHFQLCLFIFPCCSPFKAVALSSRAWQTNAWPEPWGRSRGKAQPVPICEQLGPAWPDTEGHGDPILALRGLLAEQPQQMLDLSSSKVRGILSRFPGVPWEWIIYYL